MVVVEVIMSEFVLCNTGLYDLNLVHITVSIGMSGAAVLTCCCIILPEQRQSLSDFTLFMGVISLSVGFPE